MTRKKFAADTAAAREAGIDRVSGINVGQSDGEAVFTYRHDDLPGILRVQILATDVDGYPDESSFFVFTECDDVPAVVMAVLSTASDSTAGMDVASTIRFLSGRLGSVLDPDSASCQNIADGSDEDLDYSDDDSDDTDSLGLFDDGDGTRRVDPYLGINSTSGLHQTRPQPRTRSQRSDQLLRRDLFLAHKAGFLVGVLEGNPENLGNVFSLSLRIEALGIPEDMLEAWNLRPDEYAVLLFRFDNEYHELKRLLADRNATQKYVFGKCKVSKPSCQSAAAAFSKSAKDCHEDARDSFVPTIVSNTINSLLAEDLLNLLTLRQYGASWDQARMVLAKHMKAGDGRVPLFNPDGSIPLSNPDGSIPLSNPDGSAPLFNPDGSSGLSPPPAQRPEEGRGEGAETEEKAAEEEEEKEETRGMNEKTQKDIIVSTALAHLNEDHAAGDPADLSTPLIAMQLALRHFARCAEYCMVCHRRIGFTFQAIKPYVCAEPLCTFQYMSMGLGPSAEHEIVHHPQVIDLLVSCFYASAVSFRKREWPVGLSIRIPPMHLVTSQFMKRMAERGAPDAGSSKIAGASRDADTSPDTARGAGWGPTGFPTAGMGRGTNVQTPPTYFEVLELVRVDMAQNKFTVPDSVSDGDLALENKVGQWGQKWFVLATCEANSSRRSYHCRVLRARGNVVSFEPVCVYSACPFDSGLVAAAQLSNNKNGVHVAWAVDGKLDLGGFHVNFDAILVPYTADADDFLDRDEAARGLVSIMQTIPKVSAIRKYLTSQPKNCLRDWDLLSPAAATLLRWIIASNRSFIVQTKTSDDYDDGGGGGGEDTDTDNSESGSTSATVFKKADRVPGIDGTYLQFKISQGSVDKEHRFATEMDMHAKGNQKVPTIFAWHGSSLANWHSIVRSGLDSSEISHGRSFGHGVYLSSRMSTSIAYMGSTGPLGILTAHTTTSTQWPSSELGVSGALGLFEVVNCPEKFVSTSPHIVVQKPDWIQVRYLFVQARAKLMNPACFAAALGRRMVYHAEGADEREPESDPGVLYLDQDRNWVVKREGPVQVPLSAVPKARRHLYTVNGHQVVPETEFVSVFEGGENDDIALVASGDEPFVRMPATPTSLGKRRRETSPSPDAHRLLPTHETHRPGQGFCPGTLDLGSLPKMPEPAWASPTALKQMSREASVLQKLMATSPLHDLGWYVDFNRLTNLCQWIVELHSFDESLPLARDMQVLGCQSIVLEMRFPGSYPMSPPFVRVVRPRFLPFLSGGGGHVTAGGALCMELLTSSGWSPVYTVESVLLQVRMAMCSLDPQPARLLFPGGQPVVGGDYGIEEACHAFVRAAVTHGWRVPDDFKLTSARSWA